MIKHAESTYQAGRPRGPWFKWKRDPLLVDTVLMYAQRGHGKRSSFYSDFTFGCWRPDENGSAELVPVGKAYSGFTDAELAELDRWVRKNTTNRFGPVREVEPGVVFEVASIPSTRPGAINPASPCAFPGFTASAGTSPSRKPTSWKAWKH